VIKPISIYIQPNASKNEISGKHDGAIKVRIKSPATDGKANKELIKFLAKHLSLKQSQITIVKGHLSRHKLIEIDANNIDSLFECMK